MRGGTGGARSWAWPEHGKRLESPPAPEPQLRAELDGGILRGMGAIARRTQMTLPSGTAISYTYSSSTSHDDGANRVTEVKDGGKSLAKFDYLGTGHVVGTCYDEPDVFQKCWASGYADLDRLGRVIHDRWTKDLSPDDVDFFDTDITWNQTDDPAIVEDNVHTGFDVSYTLDELSRVTRAEEGTWSGSAITSRTRDQQRTRSCGVSAEPTRYLVGTSLQW